MVTWYGIMPNYSQNNVEAGDKWHDPDGTWREWTGTKWKEIVVDSV